MKINLVLVIFLLGISVNGAARITSITPRFGSLNGATRLTIYGTGFSSDQFNFGAGRSQLGNRVKLVSDTHTYDCDMHKDGTTQQQIMCYTRPMLTQNYYVRVSVDGVPVPVSQHCKSAADYRCRFTPYRGKTPTINRLTPTSALPGSVVKMEGTIYTSRYGSNQDESTNGKTEKILRAYVGSTQCNLRKNTTIDEPDVNDELYGIELDNFGASNKGYMKCKMSGQFVGNSNVSFIIEGEYGRSQPQADVYRVTALDKVTMFQTYAQVFNITPSTGSVLGGTRMTIEGRYFDKTVGMPVVHIAGQPCDVRKISDTQIFCDTRPRPASIDTAADGFLGNRGVTWDTWNDTVILSNDLEEATNYTYSDATEHLDETDWQSFDKSWTNYIVRMHGYFVPPRNGQYRFFAKSDDESVLLFSQSGQVSDMEKIATVPRVSNNYFKYPSQTSAKFTLEGGKGYPYALVVRQRSGYAYGRVAVHMSQTALRGGQAASAVRAEQQTISTTSIVNNEIQTVQLTNWNSQGKVDEIQEVDVTSDMLGGVTFRLGLNGVFTGPLPASTITTTTMKKELDLLVTIAPESVSVTKKNIANGVRFTVTFQSEKGDIDDLVSLLDPTLNKANATITVTEKKKGKPSMSKFSLVFDGIPSPPISKTATATEVKAALEEVFSVRCPSFITKPVVRPSFHLNFESAPVHWESGTRTTVEEPFCGQKAVKNPSWLFRANNNSPKINFIQTSTLCFAYKGSLKQKVYVQYLFKESGDREFSKTAGDTFATSLPQANSWRYTCVDIKQLILTKRPSVQTTQVKSIYIYRESSEDIFVDDIMVAYAAPTTDIDGLGPYRRLSGWILSRLSVTGDPTSGLEVNMAFAGCPFDLPLLSIYGSEVTGGENGNSTTYGSDTWKSGAEAMVARKLAATPPITGTFDLGFNGRSLMDVPANVTGEDLTSLLDTLPGAGGVEVIRTGTCAGYNWKITWKTTPGDQPLLTMNGTTLDGHNVTFGVKTNQDGGVFFDPIPGDLIRTQHQTPQVVVDINRIPSVCSESCDFEWTLEATPTVESVTPIQGSNRDGTSITLTGTGFSSTANENTVLIGGEECDVTNATSTQIQCSVGRGPAGAHEIIVNIAMKGLANHTNGMLEFTYLFNTDAISPVEGSLAGGTYLTISGTGFGPNITATVNNNECSLVRTNYSSVVCITPSGSAGSASVKVVDGSFTSTSPDQFTYKTSLTAPITSISSSTILVEEGQDLTINGNGFGASADGNAVIVGGVAATIKTYTDTQIVVTLPVLSPGSYDLRVSLEGKGYADTSTNNIPQLSYTFVVTNVFPTSGSMEGGTVLTLTGTGFSTTPEKNTITLGSVQCRVTSATSNQLVCVVDSPGITHRVTNNGVHPQLGEGYAWNPKSLDIETGDVVHWSWNAPEFTSVGYRVLQTESATSTAPPDDGFGNGPTKTAQGSYQFKFGRPGTYYYWSGMVDQYDSIFMKGVVNVVERKSFVRAVKVKISNVEAIYNTASGVSDPTDSSSCSGKTSTIAGCSDSNTPVFTGSGFKFEFLTCKTPTITDIQPTSGSSATTITITGTGFSTTGCQNQVTVGSNPCVVSQSTATQIKCSVNAANDTKVGVLYPMAVFLKNLGGALNQIPSDSKRHFGLLPHVSSVSPTHGSTRGETDITIAGDGFLGSVSVVIDTVQCRVKSVAYDEIICTTSIGWEFSGPVSVRVVSNNIPMVANCSGTCDYEFRSSDTAVVDSVSPTTIMNSSEVVTIQGSGFGSVTSDVSVTIGETSCVVLSVSDTSITCNAGEPLAGSHRLGVVIAPNGAANSTIIGLITVTPAIESVMPVSGSIKGGTLITLNGLGFKEGSTEIRVGSSLCPLISFSPVSVKCRSPPGSNGAVKIGVTSNSVSYPLQDFSYLISDTPTISGLSTSSGNPGETLVLSGTGFGNVIGDVNVTIDDTECSVTAASDTSVSCTLGAHSGGEFPVVLERDGKGLADGDFNFRYALTLSGVSPNEGSFGGNQLVTITGRGFDASNTSITICDAPCVISGSPSPTQTLCMTPSKSPATGTVSCDIVARVANTQATSAGSFTYKATLTPTITNVNPSRGSTAGGTRVTISGAGFGSDAGQVDVTLAGTTCNVTSVSDTVVECTTQAHRLSIQTKVKLEVGTAGIATQDNADFEYVDVWSSPYTWNNVMPKEGDLVVIPANMKVLLDINTPVLKLLLINGGKLIFDEVDVELQAEVILITNGGLLQVGTEEQPFEHRAIITLHGHVLSQELPIYGTKTIAVREGTLDLHGKPVGVSWTRLASTAAAGSSSITLEQSVGWQPGDVIAIASTGDRHSQRENEVREISAVSNDNKTLSLTIALGFKHMGETVTLASGHTLEARAEVGLLSRNVLVRGSNNKQWADVIEACPEGFDTGEFATQTCFQGRFGEEMGSDMYGVQIMLSATRPDEHLVTGRIENIEMMYAGQAFRLGRYAIHFHLNGDMSGNYVRSCAIHHSFNRAVNIHNTHYVTIEHNVIYDIMGGAFFLEDGIEIGNVFQYNLALFVKSATSLQNDDITPAAYWVTNANNTLRHNVAAGGTHFGFWYRMHKHPDGPSFDFNICPQHVPMGEFTNNTVHSQGWFGIWIFQEFYPMEGGGCHSTNPIAAKFYSLTAWNNEKGAEWVGGGAIQFHDFLLANNQVTGIEMKLISKTIAFSEDRGAMLKGCVIASRPQTSNVLATSTSSSALILPYARGLLIKDMTFINFDASRSAVFAVASIQGKTEAKNGGFTYRVSGLTFVNSPNKVMWRWAEEGVIHDMDGTLTGIANGKAVPSSGILPSDSCTENAAFSILMPGSICGASVNFHRFAFNDAHPESLVFKNVTFTSRHGTTVVEYKKKRVTHKRGWEVVLVSGEEYKMEFVNGAHLTNITYTGVVYDLKPDQWVIISHNLTGSPDRFQVVPGVPSVNGSSAMVSYANNVNGDWYFDANSTIMSYIIRGPASSRKRRGISPPEEGTLDRDVKMKVYQCFFKGCSVPLDPHSLPPPANRPPWAVMWSNVSAWHGTEENFGGNYGDGTFGPPRDGHDVKIKTGVWMVADTRLPVMKKLFIYGTLEFEWQVDPSTGRVRDFELSCTHIFISGGRLIVGWPDNPFTGSANIVLRGDHLTPQMSLQRGPNVGAKALAVFGGLDLHGVDRAVSWTRLAQTAAAGSRQVTLETDVDWAVGDEIVIAPTGYNSWETETMKITAVTNNRTLTLNTTLAHKHIVGTQNLGSGRTYTMAAEVGLLTRNIKVIGGSYDKLLEQAFGARVLVGTYTNDDGNVYTGYARLSNVEFYHSGQEGWTDFYDPRFSLAFLDSGPVSDIKPSYVSKCAFHHGFSPAIGIFGAANLTVTDNVIHHTVGAAIQDWGIEDELRRNLAILMVFPGTFNGRNEERLRWAASIETHKATRPVLTGNTVAGSERAGYRLNGEPCPSAGAVAGEDWADNTAHSVLIGVEILPGDGLPVCSMISNFTVWKAWDFSVYTQALSSVIVSELVSIDSTLGLYPMVIGPKATKHAFAAKTYDVKDSVFVGTSSVFDCATDKMSSSDKNIKFSAVGRSWRSRSGGRVGLAWPTFSSGSNNCPEKPFFNIMAYNAIGGLMRVTGTTFVNFGTGCPGQKDVVVTTNPFNDDAQHPLVMAGITLVNVDVDNKVYIHRPRVGKINPSDCVDMDCDGLKKALLQDVDGSLLGSPGAIISQSEFEWDGDRRRGLGDYRIPKTMITDRAGNRIQVDTIAPNKGIIRDGSCTYKSVYQAYECHGYDYKMLMLESLDEDTETRRLSPVALLGDGYLDLVNGPQDHGWCFGYTCQKRLSIFPLIVALGKYYTLDYSGTSPQNSRLRLLNSDDADAIVIGIYYAVPQRLDVYVDGNYISPENAVLNSDGQQVLTAPVSDGQFMPNVTSDPTGSNYFLKADNTLHILVRGNTPVDIRTSPLIVVTFNLPAMSVDDFYGTNLVSNLALFLGIPANKIRVAKAVMDNGRRRRRSVGTFKVELEISNQPSNSTNGTGSSSPDDLSYDQLHNMTSAIINSVQLGTLASAINVTILGFNIIEPAPAPSSATWRALTASTEAGESYNLNVQIPQRMEVAVEPVALSEGNVFITHPVVYMVDANGAIVQQLGSKVQPWKVTASLLRVQGSSLAASLVGTTTAEFQGSYANFTALAIDYSGTYKLEYRITFPAEGSSLFSAQSVTFEVAERTLAGSVVNQDRNGTVGQPISFDLQVIDAVTKVTVENIAWKGHTWTCAASLHMPEMYTGSLSGTTMLNVSATKGNVTFDDLSVSHRGRYYITFRFVSVPTKFDFQVVSQSVDVYPSDWVEPVISVRKNLRIRFNADYNSTMSGKEEHFEAAIRNFIWNNIDMTLSVMENFKFTEGSIWAAFVLGSNSSASMDTVVAALWGMLEGGNVAFNFNGQLIKADPIMYVDNEEFFNPYQVRTDLTAGAIAGIVLACIAVLAICVVLIVIVKKKAFIKKKGDDGSRVPMVSRNNSVTPTPMRRNVETGLNTNSEVTAPSDTLSQSEPKQDRQFQEFTLANDATKRAPIPDKETLYSQQSTAGPAQKPPPTVPSRVWGEPKGASTRAHKETDDVFTWQAMEDGDSPTPLRKGTIAPKFSKMGALLPPIDPEMVAATKKKKKALRKKRTSTVTIDSCTLNSDDEGDSGN